MIMDRVEVATGTGTGTTVFSWKLQDFCGKALRDDLYSNVQVDDQVDLAISIVY